MQDPLENQCHALYQAKAAGMILYGRALGLSHAESEDVLQETFLALLRMKSMPKNLEHYCLRTFRNRAINHRRGFWRRLARELESHRWFDPPVDNNPAVEAAMRRLASLPGEQREVIVLKIWHDHTFEEIGSILDLSPNTVAARYRYGLQKLRAFLEGDSHERTESTGIAGTTASQLDAPTGFHSIGPAPLWASEA